MPRREEWQKEIDSLKRHESWSLDKWNCPVKVVPLFPEYKKTGAGFQVSGYFTTSGNLIGKNPSRMATDLGLKLESLSRGARILKFKRLPQTSEYEYQLTAQHPGGLAYSFMSDPNYPPGHKAIHQYELKNGISVSAVLWVDLHPNDFFSIC